MVEEKVEISNGMDETSLIYMLKLATPMVVTTLSFTIMQFVDRFMVSRLGTDALAAILPASVVSFLPTSFATGAMTSLNTVISQSLGKGDRGDCSNYFWQMLHVGFVYFVVVVAVMWPAAPWIFKIMGQPQGVANMEVIYFRIMLYAHLAAVINYASAQFFIGIHRPVITMCSSLCGQVVNVAANYVLIFGHLGFPRMGIAGSGWGTFIGITVTAAINMAVFLGGDMNRTFKSRRKVNIDFSKMYDLLKVGIPVGFGLTANVLTAAVGKTIGEDRKYLAAKQTAVCLRIVIVYIGLVSLCFLLFRNALMAFWSSDNKVIEVGVNILICAAIYQVFQAVRVIYDGALRGAGDTVWPAFVSALGATVILGLGGLFTVKLFPSLGSLGPWVAATFTMILVGLANRWRFKTNKWMNIDLFKRRVPLMPVPTDAVVE
ncbi:MAG: MATE family efflux transporter [Planctomycetota bacterium]|nr:MATE family efflux transporter [Planctomycetota bacterium]